MPETAVETPQRPASQTTKRKTWRYWPLLNRGLGRFSRKHGLIACLLIAASLAGRVALLPIAPIPHPGIQDEFSYLLAADTFASGRLTNPTHPLWRHFETVHEIMRPSYQSKFPPAQGMVLALGEVLFGHPWFGVWLSVAAMTGAIYWACACWLPSRWALLAGIIALLKIGMITYWSSSYWGGAVAAGAGALVIGAVARLRRAPSFGTALTLAAGLAVLANSRPIEGFLFAIGAVGVLIYSRVPLRRLWMPLALVLIPAAAWMLYYNYRTTGSPFDVPYAVHHRQYDIVNIVIWADKALPQPPVDNAHIRAVHRREFESRAESTTGMMRFVNFRILCQLYLGIPLSLCILCALPFTRWWRLRAGPVLAMALPMILGLMTYVWVSPHYAAPATAAYYIVGIVVLRRMFLAWPVATQCLLAFIVFNAVWQYKDPTSQFLFDKREFVADRKAVLEKLEQAPGKKVVFVKYEPGYDVNLEWIYNRADIDHSETIWAHEMGPARNRELINYYPDRQFWRLVASGNGRVELTRLPTP
jgi:hypothetical protein